MVLQDDTASGIIFLLLDLNMGRSRKITSAANLFLTVNIGSERNAYKASSGGDIKYFLNTFTSQRAAFYIRASANIRRYNLRLVFK
jgi:hypothetical protein